MHFVGQAALAPKRALHFQHRRMRLKLLCAAHQHYMHAITVQRGLTLLPACVPNGLGFEHAWQPLVCLRMHLSQFKRGI